MKKKVMFLLGAFDKGGIEKVTLDIVNNLDPEKYDITIYTIWYGGHCQSLVKPHIQVKPFFFKKYVRGIVRLINILPPKILYRLFIKGKYDVEIAAGDGECSKIISGSLNKNSKKISWIHMDVIERGSKMKVFNNVHKARKIYSKFDLIACVSDVCKAKFTTKFGYFNNICTVYNPIPKDDIIKKSQESVNDIKFKNNESLNLITVGRLVEQKGYDRLIECCNKLINDDKLHFNLYIIGDGPDKNKLMELVNKYNLNNNIKFLGFKDNPYKYISKSDIYVLSSRDEAFPLVVGEAIILNKLIIATECSGIKEWLGDSEYGLVVDNDQNSLYEGLKLILTNNDLCTEYKSKVSERADNIDFKSVLDEFEDKILR